jgi:predicted TIM-barrel fold metal-dependent hydrolase
VPSVIEDVIVVDAVVHGYDFRPEMTNAVPGRTHQVAHLGLSSKRPEHERYSLSANEFERNFSAEQLVSCVFSESQVDFAAYHHLRGVGGRRPPGATESSPIEKGIEARKMAPGRVFLYPMLANPWDVSQSKDEIDRLVEQDGVVGLKFFPEEFDPTNKKLRDVRLDDRDIAFPIIEHARKRGIKVIAVHKAMGASIRAYGLADMDDTVAAFPDMNFEIVHAGMAFVEDTVRLAVRKNVYLNLESTSGLLSIAPRRFAEVLGQFLVPISEHAIATDRVIWASGAVIRHPQPLLELFWNFKMPEDLMEGYGYPEITREMKRKMLGENWARMHGFDLKQMVASVKGDRFGERQSKEGLAEPWNKVREAA